MEAFNPFFGYSHGAFGCAIESRFSEAREIRENFHSDDYFFGVLLYRDDGEDLRGTRNATYYSRSRVDCSCVRSFIGIFVGTITFHESHVVRDLSSGLSSRFLDALNKVGALRAFRKQLGSSNILMKILNRYLAVSLLKGYLPVLAIFLAIFSLIVFVEELELGEVSKGRYTFLNASEFLLLTMPSRFVFLAPFVALLGSIMALGGLANGRELIAMQAGGISPYQIAWSVMKVGAWLILVVGFLEEFVTPHLDQEAHFKRSMALSDSGAYKGKQGFWFREGKRFVRIQEIRYGEVPQGIDIFEFNDEGQMTTYMHAQEADIKNPQKWTLKNIKKQVIQGFSVSQELLASLEWDSPLKQKEVRLLTLPASSLAPSELYQYIEVLKRKKQNSLRYELSFWAKLLMPLNTGLMILVAIPFVFGPLRMAAAGKRVFIGSLAGLGYYLMTEIFKYVGILFGASPFLTTAAPFLILSVVTLIFWRRYVY